MASPATIVAAQESGALILRAQGDWLVGTAAELDRRLHALDLPSDERVTLDLAEVERLDTTGAWLLLRTEHALADRGNSVALANVHPSFAPLIDQIRARGGAAPLPHPIPSHHTLVGFVARIGEVTIEILRRAYSILGFAGLVSITIDTLFRRPGRLRMIGSSRRWCRWKRPGSTRYRSSGCCRS